MKTKNKRRKLWLLPIVLLGLLIISFWIPLPYYIEVPGGSDAVSSVLRVNKEEDQADGEYQFVTIGVIRANLPLMLYAGLTPYTDIIPAADLTGGASDEEYQRINQFYMQTSQNFAKYQGLTKAKKEIEMKFLGVYVLSLAEDSTFKNILHLGDTVTGVNGKTFKSSQELIDYVGKLKIGDEVSVEFEDQGENRSEKGKIIKLENGKNGIGIGLIDRTEVQSDIPIEFSTEGIGGPSAGLMFSLAIYTQLADPDLRDGRIIAGTGTISEDGKVGEIGGADKKVVAAHEAGAEIFFVPDNPLTDEEKKANPRAKSNAEEAKETAKELGTSMKIVPVKTLDDAIKYLEDTKGKD